MVETPWQVFWCGAEEEFYYYHGLTDFTTWDNPLDMPSCWMCVIESGVADNGDETHELRFYNNSLKKYSQDADCNPVMPSLKPPAPEGFASEIDSYGDWCYVDRKTGDVFDYPVVVKKCPDGWRVMWCVSEQSFYWSCVATGEKTFEPPYASRGHDNIEVDCAALIGELQEHGFLPLEGNDVVIKECYRKFLLKCHPDKMQMADKEQEDFFRDQMEKFASLSKLSIGSFGDSRQRSDGEVDEAMDGHGIVAFPQSLLAIENQSGSFVERTALAEVVCIEKTPADRKEGFVELERGEFDRIETQLRLHVTLASPAELEQSLLEDEWWQSWSWLAIAKALYVQRQMFVQDGWDLRPFLVKPMIEAALRQDELGEQACKSSEILHKLLFEDCCWVKKKLQKCKRLRCISCDLVCEDECFRLCRKLRPDDMKFHHVFCKQCYRKVLAESKDFSDDVYGNASLTILHLLLLTSRSDLVTLTLPSYHILLIIRKKCKRFYL